MRYAARNNIRGDTVEQSQTKMQAIGGAHVSHDREHLTPEGQSQSAQVVRLNGRRDGGKVNGANDDDGGKLKERWTKVANRLRTELGEDLYSSWFARMEPEGRV